MFGPYRLNREHKTDTGTLTKTTVEAGDTVIYVIVGRYCKEEYIDSHYYKKELKKYLQHEPKTKAYFICPEGDTASHSELVYYKTLANISPNIKAYSVFETVYQTLIAQLPIVESVRLYGHSYGGYFSSRMLRELLKYYDRQVDAAALTLKAARDTLNKLAVVTFGGARYHSYMHHIKHLAKYRPRVRHFVYSLDFIQMLHSDAYKRPDVVMLLPSVADPSSPQKIFQTRLIFHNYEPFIQFIYQTGRTDLLNPSKPTSKLLEVSTGNSITMFDIDPLTTSHVAPYDVVGIAKVGRNVKLPSLPIVPARHVASISKQSPLPGEEQ